MSDIIVHSGSVPIAVRDHGGDGPPVLLLHGAGGNLLGWHDVPHRLTPEHRVVSLDLRGHGHSGDGDWTFEAALADVRAVADHFGFAAPAIVGHSMGGMLAILWARDNPDCPAAVSLDGHRSAATHEPNYAGLDVDTLRADLAAITELFDAEAAGMDQPVPPEVLAAMRTTRDPNEDEADFEARLMRGLVERDGGLYRRPGTRAAQATRFLPEFMDSLPTLTEVTVPFLMVLAARDLPGLPPRFAPLMAARLAGLRRDLAELRERRSNVEVVDVDASHNMVAEAPDAVSKLTREFLGRAVSDTPRS